jgi:hypothetical protein
MAGEFRKRAWEIFERVRRVEPERRAYFLEEECAGDASMREEVESLLTSQGTTNALQAELQAASGAGGGNTRDHGPPPAGQEGSPGGGKLCVRCNTRYPADALVCPKDGELLVEEAAPLVGTSLDGLYHVEELLGRGGMGAVYRARHVLLQDVVAIKVLSGGVTSHPDWLRRFVREGRVARSVRHPNIVAVFDLRSSSDGVTYMVQEYAEGRTLRTELQERARLTAAEALEILGPVADALDAAHAQGIVHRDLKPENIMIGPGDSPSRIKLLDLGIAKLREIVGEESAATLTLPGQIVGTPQYMSPEQWGEAPGEDHLEVDHRSDIYSLGVLVYEVVSGRRPFQATSVQGLRRAHVQEIPPPMPDVADQLPEAFGRAVARALSKERSRRQQTAGELIAQLRASLAEKPTPARAPEGGSEGAAPGEAAGARVALLYKRNARPDEELLEALEAQLRHHGCETFVDRHLAVGVEWAREIERQVRNADAVVVLLSAASASSEMLAYEVQIAREAARERHGLPRLLPVRVSYAGPLPEPLASSLDAIQYAVWNGPQDTPALAAQLVRALRGPEAKFRPAVSQGLEPEGGAVPLDSEFYIVRPADEEFRAAIARRDSIVLVKGARQMGKTSLLARGLQQAREAGARVVLTDLQKLNATQFDSVEAVFLALGELIADQLDLEVCPGEVWNPRRGPNVNFERYLRREVLGKVASPVVWGLDEVDRLFSLEFGGEIFGLFRSWHNERSLDPSGPWRRLTLAIAYATEAHLFITDVNQSPFNVGTRLALEDFSLEQVSELNRRYGSPLRGAGEVARFFRLVAGQPYLVRRGLHEMAAHGLALSAFEAQADRDGGPFGDHLRRILVLLARDPSLCEVIRGVLRGRPCPTQESFYRLRSAGVLTGDSARDARPRCQIYASYLERHLK